MEFKKILLDIVAFTADTQELNIPSDNVKYLDIGLCGMQSGATACTINPLGRTLDEIHATLGGERIVNLHMVDLIALQNIWEDCSLWFEPGAATGNLCHLMGARLPLHVTKLGKSLSCRFTHLDQATIHDPNSELSVGYQYREAPFAAHFNYQYHEANSTVAMQEINLDYYGCDCIGILLYATTVPSAAAAARSIGNVKVLVDDREIFHDKWLTMVQVHGDQGTLDATDDAVAGAFLQHYRWLDFQQEPLPAGKLRLLTQDVGAPADAIRIVPIYIQPNQAIG